MPYKQPRSIQVVIFSESTAQRLYLLLRRLPSHGGFWQSVTGSLENAETHLQAAVREVREETGLNTNEQALIDLGVYNRFEIAAPWRSRYVPGITHNEEVCFGLLANTDEVLIDPSEHDAYVWVEYQTAVGMVYWDSSKRALNAVDKLPRRIS
jgi:dATP pyrophosphohydrolase